MAFPLNPTNGQQTTINGVVYTYSVALTAWTVTSSGGSLLTASDIQTSGNIAVGGYNSAVGNITGSYFFGNGSQLTGITGTGNYSNANAASFLAAFGSNVISTTGNVYAGNVNNSGSSSVAGNITVGNVLTGGFVSAAGQVSANTLYVSSNANILGSLNVQGNVTFINSNVITTNDLSIELANNQSSYSNINGAGLNVGPTSSPLVNWTYNSTANVWSTNVGISASGNVSAGNLKAVGYVTVANGLTSTGIYTGSYSDGIVVDYLTGNARISAGSADGIQFFNGGVANTVIGGFNATGNFSAIGNITGNISTNNIVNSGTSATGNIGSATVPFNTVFAVATSALYADVAERFAADADYLPGTVVELGGTAEVTCAMTDLSENVFGVISTRAAYLMNSGAGADATHPPIAMTGRVPVRVIGVVNKGDRLVSAGAGLARAALSGEATAFNVIGRSLVNKSDSAEGVVEAIVTIK